jgi:hypothetical protein
MKKFVISSSSLSANSETEKSAPQDLQRNPDRRHDLYTDNGPPQRGRRRFVSFLPAAGMIVSISVSVSDRQRKRTAAHLELTTGPVSGNIHG